MEEDRIAVYSAIGKEFCGHFLNGFSKRHQNTTTDLISGISVGLHERYLTEIREKRPQVDVFWSSGMDLQMSLVLEGYAARYRSPESHGLPEGAVYDDMAYATTAEPLVTLINRQHVDASIPAGTIAEIYSAIEGDPNYFGNRIACADIERNGVGFLAMLHESQRTVEFETFLAVLGKTRPQLVASQPELVAAVSSGRAFLAYHVLASFALRAVGANPALQIATTNQPLVAISRIAFISKSAPHPKAAQLFLDHLVSPEGQSQLNRDGLFAIRNTREVTPVNGARSAALIPIAQCCKELLDPAIRNRLHLMWQSLINGGNLTSEIS